MPSSLKKGTTAEAVDLTSVTDHTRLGAKKQSFFPLVAAAASTSFLLTSMVGKIGITWDEFYIAEGGRLVSLGQMPLRDFGTPNGPFIYFLQAMGEFLFPSGMFAYSFSAATLNAALVGWVVQFARGPLGHSAGLSLLFGVLTHFCFFGGAGCLWYNQLAVAFCFLPLLYYWQKPFPVGWLGAAGAFAFLTKPDFGAICIFYTAASLWHREKKGNVFIYILSVPLLLGLLLMPFLLYADAFSWLNWGQVGFDNRLARLHAIDWKSLLDPTHLAMLGILALVARQKEALLLGLILWLGALLTKMTSGVGGGFLIPVWCAIIVVHVARFHPSKCLFTLLLASLCLIGSERFLLRFRPLAQEKLATIPHGPLKGLVSDEPTITFFSQLHSRIEALHKLKPAGLTAYTSGVYLLNSPLTEEVYFGGPLWPDVGTTLKWGSELAQIEKMRKVPPDLFYVFGSPGDPMWITSVMWESSFPLLAQWVRHNYQLELEGTLINIGTGAGQLPITIGLYVHKSLFGLALPNPAPEGP